MNNYREVETLLKKATTLYILSQKDNSCINICDDNGFTPLHHATQQGQTPMIDLLIENGADVNVQTENEQTCLHLAIILCYRAKEVSTVESDPMVKYIDVKCVPIKRKPAIAVFLQ